MVRKMWLEDFGHVNYALWASVSLPMTWACSHVTHISEPIKAHCLQKLSKGYNARCKCCTPDLLPDS